MLAPAGLINLESGRQYTLFVLSGFINETFHLLVIMKDASFVTNHQLSGHVDNNLAQRLHLRPMIGMASMCYDGGLANIKTFPMNEKSLNSIKRQMMHKMTSIRTQWMAFERLEKIYKKKQSNWTKNDLLFVKMMKTWFEMFSPTCCVDDFRCNAALNSFLTSNRAKRRAKRVIQDLEHTLENLSNDPKRIQKVQKCVVIYDNPNEIGSPAGKHVLEPLVDSSAVRCNTPIVTYPSTPVEFGTPEECREAMLRKVRVGNDCMDVPANGM